MAAGLLEALGVYTSKAFSLIETGEQLHRHDEPSPTRSSVLVRLSHSHIRFGTFQRQAYAGDADAIGKLVEYCIRHYHPAAAGPDMAASAAGLLREVVAVTAELAASWMAAGFVHGVLNTDNMNVTGESFDYGPWRFLPTLEPEFTAAYFDHSRLYAYGRQPEAVRWNLERLAEALALRVPAAQLARALVEFEACYLGELSARLLDRLGVAAEEPVADALLAARALCFLHKSQLPFDRLFFDWYGGEIAAARALAGPYAATYRGAAFTAFRDALAGRPPARPEVVAAPYFQGAGPTTMHIDEVERVFCAIAERDDWTALTQKIAEVRALGRLYEAAPPADP